MQKIPFLLFLLMFLSITSRAASAQQLLPIGDTGVFCLIDTTGGRKLATLKSGGYDLTSESGAVAPLNKSAKKLKAKRARLNEGLSGLSGAKRKKVKAQVNAIKIQLQSLDAEKKRISDCLDGVAIPAGSTPIKFASLQASPGIWRAYAYIDPSPVRIKLPGGGFSDFGAFGSLWCITYAGAFSDGRKPPWTEGTEFSVTKDFDLCDPTLNAPAGACKDKYGNNNAGIPVLMETGTSEDEARAKVSVLTATISYAARIKRSDTCAGDLSLL